MIFYHTIGALIIDFFDSYLNMASLFSNFAKYFYTLRTILPSDEKNPLERRSALARGVRCTGSKGGEEAE